MRYWLNFSCIRDNQSYLSLDACHYRETDKFYVTFHNTDQFPIDVLRYNQKGNEELMKSRLIPDNEMTVQTSFTLMWKFRRSDSKEYLKASGNGMIAQVFEGCRFQAKPNERITGRLLVTISFLTSTSTYSSNLISSAVTTPLTNQPEQITSNASSLPSTIASGEESNGRTVISTQGSPSLTITAESKLKTTTTQKENFMGKYD